MKPTDEIMSEPELNADRLAACWNGCRGINPDAVPDLLVALEALVATYERHNCPPDAYLARDLPAIRAAIAKARKEA